MVLSIWTITFNCQLSNFAKLVKFPYFCNTYQCTA